MAWKRFTVLAIVSSVLAACVPQQKYDDLLTAYRGQEQQLLSMQSDLQTSRANEERLRAQLAAAAGDLEQLAAIRNGAKGDIDKLLADYERLLKQVGNLNMGPLPAELNTALVNLAAQYPDVLTFDQRSGMLRFSSDFTFASGSAALNANAQTLVQKLASILNTPVAQPFEVKVVGHTDNQPVKRVASQHPSNMYLSAHRAISVRDALVGDGVAANRMQVAGYGEFRPIVPNGANGAAQNRRVEIFLAPLTVPLAPTGNPMDAGSAPAKKATPAAVKSRNDDDEPTK
ncbi:MAG: OmpA family protein [Planctomycetes bacterium]|nr:OmpA family protein [Planctomycetota bacterium]